MAISIEETKDLSTMIAQGLMGSLRSGDHKLLHHSEKSFESMFQSKLTISSHIGESTNNG